MFHTDTVVIGAGQAGLAVSRLLTVRNHDHVVLERHRIAERWLSGGWDSLRLLTPNWMTRLPLVDLSGANPDGFRTGREFATFLGAWAGSFEAPVVENAEVISVRSFNGRYRVDTTAGTWVAGNVVVATGHSAIPTVPEPARHLCEGVHQLTAAQYRNPNELPAGGVLVVGASASGAQIARENADSGRDVVLSVGQHTRLPRTYRGMDSFWWLDRMGTLERRRDEMADLHAAIHEPSLQLSGAGNAVDLPSLQGIGVRLTGRLVGADRDRVTLADDLAASACSADRRLRRLLSRIDRHARQSGLESEVSTRERVTGIETGPSPTTIDLRADGISSVIWATGYRREYPWLHVPVLDARGELVHRAGVTAAPGIYVVGLRFQTRRNSHFIDGVGHDAKLVVDHLTGVRESAADVPASRAS
jgi:putative flavoprotein involved in K+ transport